MPVFWKSSSARSRRPAGRPDAVSPWVGNGELQSADWAEIEDLLESETDGSADPEAPASQSPDSAAADSDAADPDAPDSQAADPHAADPRAALVDALTHLRALADNPVLPAGRISDRLLDIWDLANQVRPEAAVPAASLMTALLHRDLVSAAEVSATCTEIEELLTVSA